MQSFCYVGSDNINHKNCGIYAGFDDTSISFGPVEGNVL